MRTERQSEHGEGTACHIGQAHPKGGIMDVDPDADQRAREAADAGVPEDEVVWVLAAAYEGDEGYARFILDVNSGRAPAGPFI